MVVHRLRFLKRKKIQKLRALVFLGTDLQNNDLRAETTRVEERAPRDHFAELQQAQDDLGLAFCGHHT